MNVRERFVLFVSVFLRHENTTDALKVEWLREALQMPRNSVARMETEANGPMEAAHQFVRYKLTGAYRPEWLGPKV
jgi:hypothetical protein